MGFGGEGYWWHRFFRFPEFPIVTKTVTLNRKVGCPYAILHLGTSVWNRVALHNPGIERWIKQYYSPDLILSVAGTDGELQQIMETLDGRPLKGIELNYSCPVASWVNRGIPEIPYTTYLKLNHKQNPLDYDLSRIEAISINSVPKFGGGISGKLAQKSNWKFIEKVRKEVNVPVIGCSWTKKGDLQRLRDLGCNTVGIGSVMLINPLLLHNLSEYGNI